MELTTNIVDTSPRYVHACINAAAVQEFYNPDRFSFLYSNSILFPDFDRETYEYKTYERSILSHVFTDMSIDEYWMAVWIPTPGELFSVLKEQMSAGIKGREKSKQTYDVIRVIERYAYTCDSGLSVSQVMLSMLER